MTENDVKIIKNDPTCAIFFEDFFDFSFRPKNGVAYEKSKIYMKIMQKSGKSGKYKI